jgi:hypothetical protein
MMSYDKPVCHDTPGQEISPDIHRQKKMLYDVHGYLLE